jgi:hypothetical protein
MHLIRILMKIFIRKNFLSADLYYPERGRIHSEIVNAVKSFDFKDDTVVATLSDVVIKQINILIMEKKIDYTKVEVYSDFDDEPIVVRQEGFEVPSICKSIKYLNIVANLSFDYLDSCYDNELLGSTVVVEVEDIVKDMAKSLKDSDNMDEWFEDNLHYYTLLIKRIKNEG